MNSLDKILVELEPSKSLFELSVNKNSYSNDERISFKHVGESGKLTFTDSKFTCEVLNTHSESFKNCAYTVDKAAMRSRMLADITERMNKLLFDSMPQKHPRETKIGKFYNSSLSTSVEDILIETYKWMIENNSDESKKQAIKIMEWAYLKYGT